MERDGKREIEKELTRVIRIVNTSKDPLVYYVKVPFKLLIISKS